MSESLEERVEKLAGMIADSKKVVFFGGAGVSTESGIPDFRSKDGLYNQHDVRFDSYTPEYLLSHTCLEKEPRVFYEFYRQKLDGRGKKPNAAHRALAAMEKEGKLFAVITQNIDGLHQMAGSLRVYEVHGTTKKNYCDRCGKKFPPDHIFDSAEPVPRCQCGGKVRPEVTLYEELLPEDAWQGAMDALRQADLFIIGGTSLTVYPASSLIRYYGGTRTVIINKTPTQADNMADITFREPIGRVFGMLYPDA